MTAMTNVGERPAGTSIVYGTATDINNDQALNYELPLGFPDCLILELILQISSIATMMVTPEFHGPVIWVVSTIDGGVRDLLGTERWVRSLTPSTGLVAHLKPDQPALLRRTESLQLVFAEVDTNATPTADLNVYVRVRRLEAA
jgi:hypothetical protein